MCSIADSFSLGTVHHAFHFTTVAERALPGVQIDNIGAPAIGPREYAYLLEHEALPQEPDAVVICCYLGNDPIDAGLAWSEVRSSPSGLRRFLDREQIVVARLAQRLPRLVRERWFRRETGGRVADVQGHDLSPASESALDELRQSAPWNFDPMLEEPTFSEEGYLDMQAWRARETCGPSDAHYQALFAYLRSMRALCRTVPMFVLLLPDEFQVEDDLWRIVAARNAGQTLERHLAQARVSAWLEREGIPFADALPALLAVEPLADGRRHVFHLRDPHLNRRGSEVVGGVLASLVGSRLRP